MGSKRSQGLLRPNIEGIKIYNKNSLHKSTLSILIKQPTQHTICITVIEMDGQNQISEFKLPQNFTN